MLEFLINDQDRACIGEGLTTLAERYASFFPEGPAQVEIELLVASDIQALNLQYRGINLPTDVLSFPVYTNLQEAPGGIPFLLGSIVICPEKAVTYEEPLIDLVHHGLLHLIGFDHETQREAWDQMEAALLTSLVTSELNISPAPH